MAPAECLLQHSQCTMFSLYWSARYSLICKLCETCDAHASSISQLWISMRQFYFHITAYTLTASVNNIYFVETVTIIHWLKYSYRVVEKPNLKHIFLRFRLHSPLAYEQWICIWVELRFNLSSFEIYVVLFLNLSTDRKNPFTQFEIWKR